MCLCRVTTPAQGPSRKLASQGWLGYLSPHVPFTHSSLALHPVLSKAPGQMPSSQLLPQAGLGLQSGEARGGAGPQGKNMSSESRIPFPPLRCLSLPPAASRPACSCIICAGCSGLSGGLEHAAHSHSGESPQGEASEGCLCPEDLCSQQRQQGPGVHPHRPTSKLTQAL